MTEFESSKFKVEIIGKTDADNKKIFEITVPLKYFSNFWRTLEMPSINCEVYLNLTWSEDFFISSGAGDTTFKITDRKLPVVTLSTQDNIKLLEQLKFI